MGRSYGLTPDAAEVAYQDARAAIRYVRKHAAKYKVDTNKIALVGCSAGGMIVANSAISKKPDEQGSNAGYSSDFAAGITLSGAYSYIPASDMKGDDAYVPPLLMIHNTLDPMVPYSIAENTKKYLDARGTPNKLLTLSGPLHCPPVVYGSTSKVQEMMGFLTTYLSLPGQSCPSIKPAQSTTSMQQSTTTPKPTAGCERC